MNVNKEDIIGAYKIFLNRHPESMAVVESRLGKTAEANLIDFALADEFLNRPEIAPTVLRVAQLILEEEKKAASATNTTNMNGAANP
jgi:hypothetical protein